jgi:chemotaxis protein CheD
MSERREMVVKVAELAVERGDAVLISWGVGSCVALCLVDSGAGAAGMAHVLLPSPSLSREPGPPGKFPQTALPVLLARLREIGADPGRVVAKLVGGSTMFASLLTPGTVHMGERNVIACRSTLRQAGIPLVAQDVGGEQGRSVWLETDSGRIVVRSVGQGDRVL